MKVAIVSHSYLEDENQKNISALSGLCEVRCIVPRHGSVLIFADHEFDGSRNLGRRFAAYHALHLSNAQYVLASPTMGFLGFKPDVIIVEYSPWSLASLQVLLYRSMYSPQSKIVCIMKKNTFRCGPGVFGKIKDWMARFGVGRVDHIIAASTMVSELCKSEFSVPERKISVCQHIGVDVSLFSPMGEGARENDNAEEPIVVGYCGRLDADKGVQDLVESVRLVKQSVKRAVVLKLMGSGAYGDMLDDYLRSESQRVDWLEVLPPVPHGEVAGFLRTLDVFVLPSRILYDHQEHDAQALLEAMACGVACIGTRSGIIPEVLGDGGGYLVEPQDPRALSEALTLLIKSARERGMLAKRGRKKAVEEFSLSVVAKRKFNVISGVVNER